MYSFPVTYHQNEILNRSVFDLCGHAGLCYLTEEAKPIMADPQWVSKSHNSLVEPRSHA